MRLLVTGGTGFIGSHLAEEGRRRGAEVVVLGLTDRPEERANADLLSRLGAEVIPGSITDAELCRRAARGATHIFHLAVAMREGGKSDEFFESINLDGTRHLLQAATAQRVERFVYCSTIGIYGHRAPGITTEDSPLSPGNIYERTKVAAERLVRDFAENCALPAVVLRPADVYGPRDQRLLKLFKGVSRGRFPLFGSGKGRRHMVYVDDVVSAFFQACEREDAVGEGLIVAGPRACTLRELLAEVAAVTGSSRYGIRLPLAPMLGLAAVVEDLCAALAVDPPIYRRRMDFFTSDSEFDTARARRVLDWQPKVDLPEGIRRTAESWELVRDPSLRSG
jgi:nucleoside-diphosphate-sugar epimerase